jgi:beta-lactam-binding protein with PASTA domain
VSDYISATLQEGSEAVALAARPSGPEAIRARGDRRRRRNQAGLVLATVAVVAAGAGAYPLARDLGTAPAAPAPAARAVPNVTGMTLREAEQVIGQSGLQVGHVSRRRTPVPAGLVVSTSPGHGSAEPRGTRVSIVVSTGSGRVVIPNVTGMAAGQAEAILQQLGLAVEVQAVASGTAPSGTVIREQPAAGSLAPAGAVVVIGVAPPPPPAGS